MRIRVNAGETHLSIPAPTLIVLNTPVLWAYLKKNGHPLPYSRCADLIHALRTTVLKLNGLHSSSICNVKYTPYFPLN